MTNRSATAANRLAIVTGVGPGTGSAIVREFIAKGYTVAMLARKAERLDALAKEQGQAVAYPCDVTDSAALQTTLRAIMEKFGTPDVVVHNAVGGAFGDFLDIDPAVLEQNFQVNTMALLHLARAVAPAMIEKAASADGPFAIIATGNTSAYRGKAGFAGFAPTKAAQRILLESMARRLGPDRIHVAYVAIDAVIDLPWTRKRWHDAPDDFFCQPADIASEVFRVANQPRSAWSFNVEIRPHGETW